MKKPIKPKSIKSRPKAPMPPEKTFVKTAYESPPWWHREWDDKAELESLSDKEVVETLYGMDCISEKPSSIKNYSKFLDKIYEPCHYSDEEIPLSELISEVPSEIKPEDISINISTNRDKNMYVGVTYRIPNPNYDDEIIVFEKAKTRFECALQKWKEYKKKHTEANKKYREDMEKYKIWREEKIKELEEVE